MDNGLPLHERIMITLHLWMCKYCRRFKKQMLLLSKAARHVEYFSGDGDRALGLSMEARERIKKNMAAAFTDYSRG